MRSTAHLPLAGLVSVLVSSATFAADAPAAGALPPAPAILMQIGERYLTTHEIEREIMTALRSQLLRRKQMIREGTWSQADEARLAAQSEALKRQVVIVLRTKAIMEEHTRAQGMRPDELRLEERLRRRARQAGGVDALIKAEGRTLGELRDDLRGDDMRARFMRNYVPDAMAPGPREIREYYTTHRDEIKAPAMVKVRAILLARGDDAAGTLATAEKLKRELQFAPDRFAERAREHSNHRQTAERGGLIVGEMAGEETEWIGLDALVRQNALVGRAVAQLLPGKVSDVLTFAGGYALVKLEGIREGGILGIGEAADLIKKKLTTETREKLIEDWVLYYLRSTYLADGRGRRVNVGSAPGR